MRSIRFRLVLPIAFGCLAVALMIWDFHNERVIESMGMAWDTGAPIWPYQASYLFLFAVNAPAYVLAEPLFFLHHLQTLPMRHLFLLPLILFWWWWIGTRIDFGVLGRRHYRHTKLIAGVLVAVALTLLYGGTRSILNELQWWREYGHGLPAVHSILLLRTAGPVLWCVLLAGGALTAAARLIQGRFPPLTDKRPQYLKFSVGTSVIVLYVVAIAVFDKAPTAIVNRDSCVADPGSGCVHGTVADESDKPLRGIEVEFVPAYKTGDARWYATRHEWTDEQGKYNFNQLEPGEYFLAVHRDGAPDVDHPFATGYYPGVADETAASRVIVTASLRTNLDTLRLHKLEVATISVTIVWPDGTRPERSNLLFHNISYPRQAVIGDVAPQVDNGKGEFTLPKGFEYDAQAKVDCDAGKVIESRESRPVQRINVADGFAPAELTFVIPGPPCALWKPQ
ncbi:MAG: carboxypeptidase-like regulatory domain-containing protein [Candidatus Acidiferrales bacterium]|jgi:hypothetical protein